MKKNLVIAGILGAVFGASNLNAALNDSEILSLFDGLKNQGVSAKIVERKAATNPKFEQIIVELDFKGQKQKNVLFSDGEFIFPEIIDIKKGEFWAEDFAKNEQKTFMKDAFKRLNAVIKNEEKAKIIELGSDANKPVLYIFSDPLCPYCRKALENVEKEMQNANLRIILTPISSHGIEAVKKGLGIYKEVANAKSDAEKIAILRKFYASDAATPSFSDAEVAAEQARIDKYFATGAISGVPAYVNESDLR